MPPPFPKISYPWEYDEDVISTQRHIKQYEKEFDELAPIAYQDRGYGILNSGNRAIKSWYL